MERFAPHDLRRTCARLRHLRQANSNKIQSLLGHVSIQTTERYLGCKQRIRFAVNGRIGIEPEGRGRGTASGLPTNKTRRVNSTPSAGIWPLEARVRAVRNRNGPYRFRTAGGCTSRCFLIGWLWTARCTT
ncbi:MAG: site-specific integrase [Bryobacteraceae bacterium]|nr:site-specific integrase [Bryobacteraceae bacterium]